MMIKNLTLPNFNGTPSKVHYRVLNETADAVYYQKQQFVSSLTNVISKVDTSCSRVKYYVLVTATNAVMDEIVILTRVNGSQHIFSVTGASPKVILYDISKFLLNH